MEVLKIKGISVTYQRAQTKVIDGLSFGLRRGEILGVLGANGAGKSTLLRILSGLQVPSRGEIECKKSTRFGLIPQAYSESFFPWASLYFNIHMVDKVPFYKKNNLKEKIPELQNALGTSLDLSLKPQQCSGGMLQQAAIIRALVYKPDIVLADEPFSSLDIKKKASIRSSFRDYILSNGLSAVAVMHDLDDIVTVADRVLVIPGRPYTSTHSKDAHFAEIIDNKRIGESYNDNPASLKTIARNILENDI